MQILLYLCAYNQEAIFIHSALSPLSKLFLCESSTELLSALSVLRARLKYSLPALSPLQIIPLREFHRTPQRAQRSPREI